MVWNVVSRILGAGGIGAVGWWLGAVVSSGSFDDAEILPWGLALTLGGVLIGAVGAPYVVLRPISKALNAINQVPATSLIASTLGLVVGLVIAALISVPLFRLEGWPGWGVPLIVSISLGSIGLWLGAHREAEMRRALPGYVAGGDGSRITDAKILVDTSAIIDGRIADLGQTGFLQGTLIIPGFVLDELRHIADSSDPLRRARGRRGLDVLGRLRKESPVPIQVLDAYLLNGAEVDAELVRLAKTMKAIIMTNDFNLNRVAELQGIRVLNVNELANALKPMVLPGEDLAVNIVQEGKELGQGVAFLDDGTMIVVEGGRRYLNTLQDVTVTRVLQTAAGRIIFAHPRAG